MEVSGNGKRIGYRFLHYRQSGWPPVCGRTDPSAELILLAGQPQAVRLYIHRRELCDGKAGKSTVVSLHRRLRDRAVVGVAVAVAVAGGGLWNATLLLSEAGFYGMSYALALFGSVAVQKNTCDVIAADSAYAVPLLLAQE